MKTRTLSTPRRSRIFSSHGAVILAALASICLLTAKAQAQRILAWDFFGESNQVTSLADVYDSGLDSTNALSRGTGAAFSAGGNSFRTVGFQNNGISTTNTDYFQFSVSATNGKILSLASISARFNGTTTFVTNNSNAGATNQFAYSTNGTDWTLISPPTVVTGNNPTNWVMSVSLSNVAALQNLAAATTATFRFYASGQTTTGGWGFNSPTSGTYGLDVGGTLVDAGVPLITLSSSSLALGTTLSGTASTPVSYTVTGTNLGSTNITVSANSTLVEISTNGATGFSTNSINLVPSSGAVAATTIFARIAASAPATNPLTATISHVCGVATTNLAVTGVVEALALPVVTAADYTGQVGVAFSNAIAASGAPTNYVITSGTLPGGLSLNAATGVISGVPTNAVTNSIAVTAQNVAGTSDPATIGFTIAKGAQTITFAALPSKMVGDAPFVLSATASSGLPVSYSSSDETVATVSGSTVTIVGAGSATITASQAGNDNWDAATSVPQALLVLPNNIAYWNFGTQTPGVAPAGWSFGAVNYGNNNGTNALITSSSQSSGYVNVYGISASGGNNVSAAARTGAINTNTNGSAYFEFTVVAPAASTNLAITNISFGSRATPTGPQGYSIRSSADNYAADLPGGSGVLANNSSWANYSASVLFFMTNGMTNTFRIYGCNGTGSASANTANWRIDDLTVGTGAANSTNPSITLTPNALSGLSTFSGTPSSGYSYSVFGANLTTNIVVAPDTGLEISTNNSTFTNELSLVPVAGSLSNTTLYVRIASSVAVGPFTGNVTHTSGDVSASLGVAGNVYDPSRGASTNSLVAWDAYTQTNFGSSPWSPTLQASNLVVSSGLTRGSGVLTSGTAAARGWGGVDWSSPDAATAIASNKFVTFTMAASSGYKLSISSISKFDYRRSGSGPATGLVQAQIGASNDFVDVATVDYSSSSTGGASIPAVDLSTNAALQNIAANTPVTFRIVNFAGTNTTGTWYVYDVGGNPNVDFELSGSVVAGGEAAPSGLSYAPSSTNAVVGVAIGNLTPTVTGNVTNYSVSPELPTGLSIDATTGIISGTPAAAIPAATFTVTAANSGGSTTASVTITVVSAYQGWLNGQTASTSTQLAYAIGGATSATATNGVAMSNSVTASNLSITAIVRTNDPNLSVFGQSITNLSGGIWITSDVTRITNGVDQTGVPSGNQRQIFSTPRTTNDAKKFLQLRSTLIAP